MSKTNPWMVHVKKVQKKHPELAYKDVLVKAKKSYTKKTQTGDGILRDIGRAVQKKALSYLQSRPSNVSSLLKSHGEKTITNFQVCRSPINSVIKKLLNLISGGQIKRVEEKNNYDDIYHLFLIMTFNDGSKYSIEKNERVVIKKNPQQRPNSECKSAGVNITFNDLISGAEKRDGGNLYRYDASNWNCQKFLSTLSSVAGVSGLNSFIMQDANALVQGNTKKIAQATTDVAGVASRIIGDITGTGNKKIKRRRG